MRCPRMNGERSESVGYGLFVLACIVSLCTLVLALLVSPSYAIFAFTIYWLLFGMFWVFRIPVGYVKSENA